MRTKNLIPDLEPIPVSKWREIFDDTRDENGKIRWHLFKEFALVFHRAYQSDDLSVHRDLAKLDNKNPVVIPLITLGWADTVLIQPMPNSEEIILSFTKRNTSIKPIPQFTIWNGKPAPDLDNKIGNDAIEIPLKLFQDKRVQFESTFPMNKAISTLKDLGIIKERRGGDSRSDDKKEWEQDIENCCYKALLDQNKLPTAEEIADILDAIHANGVPPAESINRMMTRVIGKAVTRIMFDR